VWLASKTEQSLHQTRGGSEFVSLCVEYPKFMNLDVIRDEII
jgi:hypothetical protein